MSVKTMKSFLKKDVEYNPSNPNAIIINDFDYNNLVGEEWVRYNDLVQEICPDLGVTANSKRNFDFEVYRARPVFKDRYPGLKGTPRDLVGIELIGADKSPIQKTRMEMKHAKNLNNQIESEASRNDLGRFYLLKKAS